MPTANPAANSFNSFAMLFTSLYYSRENRPPPLTDWWDARHSGSGWFSRSIKIPMGIFSTQNKYFVVSLRNRWFQRDFVESQKFSTCGAMIGLPTTSSKLVENFLGCLNIACIALF